MSSQPRVLNLHTVLRTGKAGLMDGDNAVVDRLLTPAEVGMIFRVDPKTVSRWARSGKLNALRTSGGHRRYPESEIKALVEQHQDNGGR